MLLSVTDRFIARESPLKKKKTIKTAPDELLLFSQLISFDHTNEHLNGNF